MHKMLVISLLGTLISWMCIIAYVLSALHAQALQLDGAL